MPNIEEYIPTIKYNGFVTEKVGYFRNLTTAASTDSVGTAGLIFGKSSGSIGIYFGSGTPTVVAQKGSIYLRTNSDGSTTRAYITTDTAGTWVRLICAS